MNIYWDGSGVAPVGAWVEFVPMMSLRPVQGRVIGHDTMDSGDMCCVAKVEVENDLGFRFRYMTATNCKPANSPEQIASEEREKFISEICGLLGWEASLEYSRRDAIKLFDAGYRKFEIVEGE